MASNVSRRDFSRLVAGLAVLSPAQVFATETTGPSLKKGLNIHHLLNWPDVKTAGGTFDYVWPPFRGYRSRSSDEELTKIKALGFDFIRLTADPSILLSETGERFEELTGIVLDTIKRLQGFGFSVMFDLHPVRVNPAYVPLKLVASTTAPEFIAYCDLLTRLGGKLQTLPHDKFVFELMNEPPIDKQKDLPLWQSMMEALHTAVRKSAPDLPVVLSGAYWSGTTALTKLDLKPFAGSNVYYTIHYYLPTEFTHQSVPTIEYEYITDLPWPASKGNAADAIDRAHTRIMADTKLTDEKKAEADAKTKALIKNYFAKNYSESTIVDNFKEVAAWAAHNNVDPHRIILGEFGTNDFGSASPIEADRFHWIRMVRETAESMGFPWAFWLYRGPGGFAIADESGAHHFQAETLEALGLKPA